MWNIVRNLDWPTRSSGSSTRGCGNRLGTVTALTLRKSVHNRRVPSDFSTITIDDAHGLSHSSTIPCSERSYSYLRRNCRFSGCSRYGAKWIGYSAVAQYCVHRVWSFLACHIKLPWLGSSLEVRYDQRHGNNIDCDATIKAKLVCRLMIVVGQLTATY